MLPFTNKIFRKRTFNDNNFGNTIVLDKNDTNTLQLIEPFINTQIREILNEYTIDTTSRTGKKKFRGLKFFLDDISSNNLIQLYKQYKKTNKTHILKQIEKEYVTFLKNKYSLNEIMFSKHMHFEFKNDNKFLDITDLEDAKRKKITFVRGKNIGEGAYGSVYTYKIHDKCVHQLYTPFQLAVKFEIKHTSNDKNKSKREGKEDNIDRIYKSLVQHDKSFKCNVIPFRKINESVYIMLKAEQNLFEWMEHVYDEYKNDRETNFGFDIIKRNIRFILSNVTEQLLCLLSIDKEFVYTDLKPENIVVNCNSQNDISDIYLIDIESVLKDRTNSRIITYECKQLKDRNLENSLENKKRCIAYLIAVLAYELLVFDLARFETKFYIENIDKMSILFEKHDYLIVDDLLHPDIKRVTDALNRIKKPNYYEFDDDSYKFEDEYDF